MSASSFVPQDHQSADDDIRQKDEKTVDDFLSVGCGCQRQCHKNFTRDTFVLSRLGCKAMDYYDDDHVNHFHIMLLGSLYTQVCDSQQVLGQQSKHKETDRVLTRFQPYFRGIPMCQKHFCLHFIAVRKSLKQ